MTDPLKPNSVFQGWTCYMYAQAFLPIMTAIKARLPSWNHSCHMEKKIGVAGRNTKVTVPWAMITPLQVFLFDHSFWFFTDSLIYDMTH